MALVKCKECKKEVSTNAKSCPHCGVANPGISAAKGCLGIIIFAVVFGTIVGSCSDEKEKSPTSSLSDKECRESLQCWGEKHNVDASVYCKPNIERVAKYSFKWTDGLLEPRFSHYRWKDKEQGTITYIGDKLQLQNGFGAWSDYIYECDYSPTTSSVLDIRAQQGRL